MIPTVSVAIATYNYGRYLAEALDSALGQTYDDTEIVVVDDGSMDNTAEVIQPYLSHPKVRYHRADHVGQPAAKNLTIQLSQGKYIAFLDADDRWLPTKLEKQVARFESDPELGLVYTRRFWMDERGVRQATKEGALHRGDVLAEMFRNNFVCFPSSMVRRDALDDVGFFDESIPLAIDYDLWLRLSAKYRFDYIDEPLVEYRTGHANLSRRAEERLHVALGIMRRFLEDRKGRELLPASQVRLSFAETYANLGCVQSARSKCAAASSYLQAVVYRPWQASAWLGIVKLGIPASVREAIRGTRKSAATLAG